MKVFGPENRRWLLPLAALGLVGVTAAGVAAIEENGSDSASACGPLEKVQLASTSLGIGSVAVKNEGSCAEIHELGSAKSLGRIATDETFLVNCSAADQNAFQVTEGDVTGYVDYADNFRVSNGNISNHPLIPGC